MMSGDVDDFHYRFKLLYPIEAKQVHAAQQDQIREIQRSIRDATRAYQSLPEQTHLSQLVLDVYQVIMVLFTLMHV